MSLEPEPPFFSGSLNLSLWLFVFWQMHFFKYLPCNKLVISFHCSLFIPISLRYIWFFSVFQHLLKTSRNWPRNADNYLHINQQLLKRTNSKITPWFLFKSLYEVVDIISIIFSPVSPASPCVYGGYDGRWLSLSSEPTNISVVGQTLLGPVRHHQHIGQSIIW